MFGFLKKLFGSDAETNKAAGVQIEQVPVIDTRAEAANQAPYKIETPVAPVSVVEAAPTSVVAPVKKAPANKKPQAAKSKTEKVAKKPAVITAPKKASRKPKVQ